MAIPQSSPARTPQRTTKQYTVGKPDLTPTIQSLATSPNVGTQAATPHVLTLVAVTAASGSHAIAALASGASYAFTIQVPFSGLPTPLVVGQSDLAQFVCSLVSFSHARTGVTETAIPGLVLASVIVTPLAYALGGGTFQGESLQPGTTFTAWSAIVTGTVTAVAATSAGTLTARVAAALYDKLG